MNNQRFFEYESYRKYFSLRRLGNSVGRAQHLYSFTLPWRPNNPSFFEMRYWHMMTSVRNHSVRIIYSTPILHCSVILNSPAQEILGIKQNFLWLIALTEACVSNSITRWSIAHKILTPTMVVKRAVITQTICCQSYRWHPGDGPYVTARKVSGGTTLGVCAHTQTHTHTHTHTSEFCDSHLSECVSCVVTIVTVYSACCINIKELFAPANSFVEIFCHI
jgi:hypothetical protein